MTLRDLLIPPRPPKPAAARMVNLLGSSPADLAARELQAQRQYWRDRYKAKVGPQRKRGRYK